MFPFLILSSRMVDLGFAAFLSLFCFSSPDSILKDSASRAARHLPFPHLVKERERESRCYQRGDLSFLSSWSLLALCAQWRHSQLSLKERQVRSEVRRRGREDAEGELMALAKPFPSFGIIAGRLGYRKYMLGRYVLMINTVPTLLSKR